MDKHGIAVHAYVFMGNHVHLLLTSPECDGLSRAMRNAGQCYVQAFNKRHRRSGTLWQGRYKSCLVDTERYLMTVYRYIELNPVRAAMTVLPEQHHWSSVHANLGLAEDRLVKPHPIFLAQDPNPHERTRAYQAWLREGIGEDELQNIRAHLQQERALGDTKFQAVVAKTLGRTVHVRGPGRPRQPNNSKID